MKKEVGLFINNTICNNLSNPFFNQYFSSELAPILLLRVRTTTIDNKFALTPEPVAIMKVLAIYSIISENAHVFYLPN